MAAKVFCLAAEGRHWGRGECWAEIGSSLEPLQTRLPSPVHMLGPRGQEAGMLIKTPAHAPRCRLTRSTLPSAPLRRQPSSQLPSALPKAKGRRPESD